MEKVDLGFAVHLQPKDAINYFQSKGYEISWNWFDVWQEAHVRAFTVAKATRADVLMAIRKEVEQALVDGATQREFAKNLKPVLQRLGWWGRQILEDNDGNIEEATLGTPWRLKNIYRTNLQTAYMAGRYKSQAENAASRPYWQYVAVMDSKTRPAHAALHGRVFRFDDPLWDSHYPPNGWGCRCRIRALSERQVIARGLKVEHSDGKLKPFSVEIGHDRKTGEVIQKPVTGFEYTKGKFFKPDAGWSYNPGRAAWDPDNRRWTPDLAKQYEKAVGISSVTNLFKRLELKRLEDYIENGGKITQVLDESVAQSGRNFQEELLNKLRDARPLGTPAKIANRGAGAKLVQQASTLYPDDWTRHADNFGPLQVKARKNTRGWAATLPDESSYGKVRMPEFGAVNYEANAGYIVVPTGELSVAVHEYGHRLQAAMPELDAIFADLHRKRTGGDPLRRLKEWYSGYRPNEVTREDKYFNPYQGKEYDGQPLEILTMAFEWVLGSDPATFEDFRRTDPEMLNLEIGLLFHYKP